MDVLMQPMVVDKVFEFLGALDVNQCQYVCKTWRECAIRKLRKCPPMAKCRLLIKREKWIVPREMSNQDERRECEKQIEDLIMENRMMNEIEYNQKPDPREDYFHFWYEEKALYSYRLLRPEIDNVTRNFLTSDTKCVPGFSFILYRMEFPRSIENISFNYPSILVRHREISYAMAHSSRQLPGTINLKDKILNLHYRGYTIGSFFEGLHISCHNSGLKITVTDWSDLQSQRPDVGDPKFPIKCVLYLASLKAPHANATKRIRKLLGKPETTFLGGVLSDWSGESEIFLVDQKKGKPREASRITITFAGEQVRSAILRIDPRFDFIEQLRDFQHSLTFPIDDGRVVGFILSRGWWRPSLYHCVQSLISSFLARIELVHLNLEKILGPFDDNIDTVLLIIRF